MRSFVIVVLQPDIHIDLQFLYSTPYSLYRLSGFFNKNNSLNFLYFQFFSFVNQPFLKQMSNSSFFGKILLFQEWRFFQKPVRDLA